jgi:hypothetical protein
MRNKQVTARLQRMLTLMLALTLLSGCVGPHQRLNNAMRLAEREDFPDAALNAPEWTRDALHTINELEYRLERQ